jgi:apolipoprotein N-acyltransferase
VVDPWGKIGEPLPFFTEGMKIVTIHPAGFKTFYARFGHHLPWLFTLLFFALFGAALFYSLFPRRQKPA